MATSCSSEEGGGFRPEDVDLVFVDEDDMPLRAVVCGVNYLDRDSDEEVDSDFYQTDSEESETEESEDLEQDTAEPPPARRRRLPAPAAQNDWKEDVIRHDELPFNRPTGPKWRISGNERPVDLFHHFINDNVLELMTVQTNLYATQERAKNPDKHCAKLHDVTKDELKTFLALNLAMGLVNKPTLVSYWSTDEIFLTPFFQKTFPRIRFTQILRYLHFVDNTTLTARGQEGYDKLGKIRPFLERVIGRFQQVYSPSRNLSVDETLIKFKGRLSWRQFMKDKPARFGLKEFTLADSANGYVLDIIVYTGKETAADSKGLAERVVLRLLEPFYGFGYNIFMDNYYTSVGLFEKLYDNGVQACGTCRGDRIGLPRDVTKANSDKVKKLKRGEAIYRQKGTVTCVTWKDRKPVTLITTLPASIDTVSVERAIREANVWQRKEFRCPVPIQEYNSHMGGVDLADQRTTAYARLMKGWTWYLKLFYHLLEVSVLNAYVLHCCIHGKETSMMQFRLDIIRGLHGRRTYRHDLPQVPTDPLFRRNLNLGHFPVKAKKRCACKVHIQRVLTPYMCGLCDTYMCPAPCFERYHTMDQYLFNDEECSQGPPRLKPQGAGRPLGRGRPRQRRQ